MSILLLSLFVINLALALGAGLYETRVVVPEWFQVTPNGARQWNADAARRMDVGLRFWVYVTTIPLTLLTIANAVTAWTASSGPHAWWALAVSAAFIERLMTFGYFIPTMIRLTNDQAGAPAQMAARAERWVAWGSVRLVVTAIALASALRALVLL